MDEPANDHFGVGDAVKDDVLSHWIAEEPCRELVPFSTNEWKPREVIEHREDGLAIDINLTSPPVRLGIEQDVFEVRSCPGSESEFTGRHERPAFR